MYPKWVQRAPHIGAVLCLSKAEEDQLLEDYATEQLVLAEAEAAAAKADAEAAAAESEVKLAASKKK